VAPQRPLVPRCAPQQLTLYPRISGKDLEEILEVSRLTRAERQKGQEHGGKAGGVTKAQTAQTRKTCMARCKLADLKSSAQWSSRGPSAERLTPTRARACEGSEGTCTSKGTTGGNEPS
jgi:hypothetical protein